MNRLSLTEAQGVISAIDARIKRWVKSNAFVESTIGRVYQTVTGESQPVEAEVFLYGETDSAYASPGFRATNGIVPNASDYVRVEMDARGDRRIAEVIANSIYWKLQLDLNGGVIHFRDDGASSDSAYLYAKADGQLYYTKYDGTEVGPLGSGGPGGSLTDHTHAATGSGSNGGGSTLNPATLNVSGVTRLTGTISPTITADQNDWSPTGLSTANVIRVTASNNTVTGIAAQEAGRVLLIVNVGTGIIYFDHESASSTAANRIITNGGDGGRIPAGGFGWLWYDGTSSRWRLENFAYNMGEVGDMAAALAFGGSNSAGSNSLEWAAIDHSHAMPANPVTAHEASYDHTQLHARSHDHSNASDGSSLAPGGLTLPNVTAPTGARVIGWTNPHIVVGDGTNTRYYAPISTDTPSTQAVGDAAATGTASSVARTDHKHAMPSFGSVTTQTSFGASSGNGSAATIARSDHTHGTPADPTTGNMTGNARVAVNKNSGATVGTRRRLNFIEGTNVTITVADDSTNEEVDITIAASGTGMSNPMTTQGDIIYGGSSGTPTRLAKGSAYQSLKMNSGATIPEWAYGLNWGCVLYGTGTTQSVSNTIGTGTDLTWASSQVVSDPQSMFNDTNDTIVVPTGGAGKYLVWSYVEWAANATGQRRIILRKNASNYMEQVFSVGTAQVAGTSLVAIMDLADGDTVNVRAAQNSGGNLTIQAKGVGVVRLW